MKRIFYIWFNSVTIILSLCAAGLSAQADTICYDDTVMYVIPGNANSVYSWTVSGGSMIHLSERKDSVVVVWNESTGLHDIEVTRLSETACSSEPERLQIFVYKPSVNLGDDMEICDGSSVMLSVDPDFEEYLWNSQPGTNELMVNTGGIISLEVRDRYGCLATDSIMVTVKRNPEPYFVVEVDTLNHSVSVENLSDSTWHYQWDFGDGAYSDVYNPGSHQYSDFGIYQIDLYASDNGCSAISSVTVYIADPVKADFMAVYERCAPAEVTFINHSTGARTYFWDFGNGETSTEINPVTFYNEPGNYEVILYAGTDTMIRTAKTTIIVNEPPIADFEVNPAETNRYEEIQFINRSSNAIRYHWNFGDGDSSDLYEPEHSYSSTGTYDIALSAWSESGCFDSLVVLKAVTVTQDCRILFPTGFIPGKEGPNGGYYDPAQQTDNNEIFHPIYENLDAYELRIYSRWGELIFISKDLRIGWDGYFNGSLAPQDTYVYKAVARCSSGEEISAVGSVTLIY
jgi:gliding motility-associated-like protein